MGRGARRLARGRQALACRGEAAASGGVATVIDAGDIAALIGSGRFDLSSEKAVQRDIDALLAMALPVGARAIREHRLGPRDIPDFWITGGLVIEAKVDRARAEPTLRQLERYAAYETVSALILATSRAMDMPATVGGKPLIQVALGRAWL